MYGLPERQLRKILDARDVAKLYAAERQGLIPDPWLQTSEIVAAIVNMLRGPNTQPVTSTDFLYRVQNQRQPQSLEDMISSAKARHGGNR